MSDLNLKEQLSGAQWRKYKDTAVEVNGEKVPVVIRRAPPGVAVEVLDEARKAGDVGADNEPTGELSALQLFARVVATVLFAPGAVRPMYDRNNAEDLQALRRAPWLLDIRDDAMAALGSSGAVVEKLKGNSEATPT